MSLKIAGGMHENRERVEADKRQKADYKLTFESESAQRVLRDLMYKFGVTSPIHDRDSATETAYRDGQRSVVLHLLNMVGADMDAIRYRDMQEQQRRDYNPLKS